MLITVQGGTNAGIKKPLKPALKWNWVCDECGTSLRGYWTSCPNDGSERP